MLKWAQGALSAVAGTQEPEYGPEAIHSVHKQAQETQYTELTKEDLRWAALPYTNVETQTFYLFSDDGPIGMAQVIYSNVASIRTTAQFTSKIFYRDGKTPHLWSSDPLENYGFDSDNYSFHADGCSLELSEDGTSYTIKSSTNKKSIVSLKVTKAAPGFVVGKNGTTNFGTDPEAPWGTMRHAFWPRCKVEGSFLTPDGEVNFNGKGLFIHALQGMKPHHAAARWNFINFQSPTYSAIMMEYTTPPSYASTVVNVGGVAVDDKILFASASGSAKHSEVKDDPEANWPEPAAIEYKWQGKLADGKDANAEISGPLGERMDRLDVMAEVPAFVKQVVAGAVGTRPYIYQYSNKFKLKMHDGEKEVEEEGLVFSEATFIT